MAPYKKKQNLTEEEYQQAIADELEIIDYYQEKYQIQKRYRSYGL